MHLDVCSANKGWMALESFKFQSVFKFADHGKGREVGWGEKGQRERTLAL